MGLKFYSRINESKHCGKDTTRFFLFCVYFVFFFGFFKLMFIRIIDE